MLSGWVWCVMHAPERSHDRCSVAPTHVCLSIYPRSPIHQNPVLLRLIRQSFISNRLHLTSTSRLRTLHVFRIQYCSYLTSCHLSKICICIQRQLQRAPVNLVTDVTNTTRTTANQSAELVQDSQGTLGSRRQASTKQRKTR